MEFTRAREEDIPQVAEIVRRTIEEIYPDYYPREVVDFFLELHGPEHIAGDVREGNTYLLSDEGQPVATGTVKRRHLSRIYVLPGFQKKGYGRAMMEFLERKAGEVVRNVMVESSLPGCIFYEKLGYRTVCHCQTPAANGRVLVYELMQKDLREPAGKR